VFSQTETDSLKQDQIVIIKMKNGDEYKGTISKKDIESIVLKTVNGEINLIASNVRSIENYEYEGKFEFANPHDSRYLIGPSGIPIKKGEVNYQNVLITTHFVNYGITKNISIDGGFEISSTVLGSPIWYLSPKVGFDISENIHVSGGFFMASFARDGFGLGYGVLTFGNAETNLSIGAAYGLIGGELSDDPATIMISGTHRVSNSIALLSENYVFPNSFDDVTYVGIHGIRFLSKKTSFDIGAIVIPGITELIPVLPYVGFIRIF
jgi:small nuclear ribonucleoprotein (snRNP)-like protein